MNDSYGQSDGTAPAEAVSTPVAIYGEEGEEQPTDAAWLVIDTFPCILGKQRMRITQRRLRRGRPPRRPMAGPL